MFFEEFMNHIFKLCPRARGEERFVPPETKSGREGRAGMQAHHPSASACKACERRGSEGGAFLLDSRFEPYPGGGRW